MIFFFGYTYTMRVWRRRQIIHTSVKNNATDDRLEKNKTIYTFIILENNIRYLGKYYLCACIIFPAGAREILLGWRRIIW